MIPDPYYDMGSARNVIIREDDFIFWNQLLNGLAVNDVHTRKRVAVVGKPGIGKSTTAAFAIRRLIKQGMTVVYLLSHEGCRWLLHSIYPGGRRTGRY